MDTGRTDPAAREGGSLNDRHDADSVMSDAGATDDGADAPAKFRSTLIKVMTLQVVTLILLWLIQSHYGTS